ncbi:glycoside hydrolase family 92 protein [Fomitopsis serialis]|uniref:glycoside hydrolase family 92 protein n=1 Tax=Fomitopsis serialis TaxID=139415 RepID=UPI002008CE42|nr:glycoside hydrolase family 92 protein [Neoantrodia serialis]KAH9935721.1 glycoside hydrolase family 92 protein [Neoantrodia serialis]
MAVLRRSLLVLVAASLLGLVRAQPSPVVQEHISAAIASAAADPDNVDYTSLVNVFIGTDNYGDVCPGASVPFGMVKFSTDMTGYAPAGYIADPTEMIRGLSPMHDSGTGSSSGTYGNFEIMPLLCPDGFETCAVRLDDRLRYRKNNTDEAYPGYFAQTLDNEIKMEATSTRRAGLERFTFPSGSKPYFTLDLANDLPESFAGGSLNIDPENGRITMGGFWGSSFGPGAFHYQAFACYDLLNGGTQKLDEYGVWTGETFGLDYWGDAKGLGQTNLNLSVDLIGDVYQSGALFSYAGDPEEITIRVGISFVSEAQACSNAETEVGGATFEEIEAESKALWNERLSTITIDFANTEPNITELLYSSWYRSNLTPNNATHETQGPYANTTHFYFDSLYCSWDTFRTFYPLMALHSPVHYAQIVDNYIDGYLKQGWMPECRANNLPGWTQGGSSGDLIVGHFAMLYHNEAEELGIDLEQLYAAMVQDSAVNPPEWNIMGRQSNVYNQYGYVPFAALDTRSTGRMTREGSRTVEYAYEDFAIRQVALLLNKTEDVDVYTNKSYFYKNVWDPTVNSDGFTGFSQKRYPNGTFYYTDPIDCSPVDSNPNRECSLQDDNVVGFYESSSWEYSFFAPHDMASVVDMMGGNETFIARLDHFFNASYFNVGNEPSFNTPIDYLYANAPTRSVDHVHDVVFSYFDITPAGLPGNDDQAAMATVLVWHLLGLYPVPGSSEILVVSPFLPTYTIHNRYLNTNTTVTVKGFNPASVQQYIPEGIAAYVQNVTINGVPSPSRCHFDFYDIFRVGGELVIEVTADKDSVNDCGASLPDSLSTGGFNTVR